MTGGVTGAGVLETPVFRIFPMASAFDNFLLSVTVVKFTNPSLPVMSAICPALAMTCNWSSLVSTLAEVSMTLTILASLRTLSALLVARARTLSTVSAIE